MKLVAIMLVLLAGCGDDANEPDERAAEETASAIDTGLQLSVVSDQFGAIDVLATTPIALAPRLALEEVERRIRAAVSANECLTVDTDMATYLDVSFDDCGLGLFGAARVDGTLHGALSFETAACGPAECPTAMLVELSTPRLRLSGPLGARWVELSGSWSLRDPIGGSAPTETMGELALTTPRGTLSVDSGARFTVDSDRCVDLDAQAILVVEGRADLGTVVVSMEGIQRCPNQCPSAGTIDISYGAGSLLSWQYDGGDTALVRGPRGKEIDLALPCSLE